MCAVFGILGDYEPSEARRALSLLAHRGPDACEAVETPRLFFAHRRLRIRETAPARQPLRRGDVRISFNGEIYNDRTLAETLGIPGAGEAQVVLAAYLRWGTACVEHFRGMFALAVYDNGTLHLFRDRLGKKPLFFHAGPRRFAFASEIKALVPLLPSVRMNDEAMMSYLAFLAPAPPHTFFEGIEKLAPGEMLTFENNTVSRRFWYDLLDAAEPSGDTNVLSRLQTELFESVSMRLDADVPVCALLSGGIDSAAIHAAAKSLGRPLAAFTLGYEEGGRYDESEAAAETARLLGLEHRIVRISRSDFIDTIDPALDALDEPLNDPAAVPLFLLMSAIAKEGYKVVLSGEGGDELFLGYRLYFDHLDVEQLAALKRKAWLKHYFHGHFSMHREWEWYKRAFDGTVVFRGSGEKFTDLQLNRLLRRNVRDDAGLRFIQPARERFVHSRREHPAHWYSYLDLRHLQGEYYLSKLDRISMAHSIEARTPMLDHRFVERAFGVPASLKIGDARPKSLLKTLLRPYLDEKILSRKKKGFASPSIESLRDSGKLARIEAVNAQTGMFRPDVLRTYLDAAEKGHFKQHVWGLYVLSHWIDKYLL